MQPSELQALLRRKYGTYYVIALQIAIRRQGLRVTQKDINQALKGRPYKQTYAAPAVILIAKQLCKQP
jgi:hypothetical protein